MADTLIAVDFGGDNTSIYKKDDGFVLKEPSLICALKTEDGYEIKALGVKAKEVFGKTDNRTVVFSPVKDGIIENEEYASILLKYFLDKVMVSKRLLGKIKCVVTCPLGLAEEEKQKYKSVFLSAGISEIILIPKILCSAYGGGVNIFSNNAHLVVDCGGNTTDIGVINMGAIIEGASLGIGGSAVDYELIRLISLKYNVDIGVSTAQKIKEEIGSLYENDTANIEVSGVDTRTKSPASVVVYAGDVKMAVLPLLQEIIKIVGTTLNILPPEISADVAKNGILLTGGLSNLFGVDKYLKKELSLNVFIAEDSPNACILGAGKLLSNKGELNSVINEI